MNIFISAIIFIVGLPLTVVGIIFIGYLAVWLFNFSLVILSKIAPPVFRKLLGKDWDIWFKL